MTGLLIRLALVALVAAAVFGGGLWLGYRAGSDSGDKRVAALQAQQAQRSAAALAGYQQALAAQQVAYRRQLSTQQRATQRWQATAVARQQQTASLQLRIDHAQLAPSHGDVLSGVGFQRVYDAAARAGRPAAAATTTGSRAGGVHKGGD